MLTVTQELNLIESDSKIYLRNDAEFVQINELATNTGSGQLSILQLGQADQYTYNIWCSPVGSAALK